MGRQGDNTSESRYRYAVVGDYRRMTYSRHRTLEAARRSARSLARKWGQSHPGSEPGIYDAILGREIETVTTT